MRLQGDRIRPHITDQEVPAAPAMEEGDDIPTNIAHDSGLELIEVD
jgi:hypothetical protein